MCSAGPPALRAFRHALFARNELDLRQALPPSPTTDMAIRVVTHSISGGVRVDSLFRSRFKWGGVDAGFASAGLTLALARVEEGRRMC